MYLTKNAKKMLDAALKSSPTVQSRFYSACLLADTFGVSDIDTAKSIAAFLELQGAVTLWEIDKNCFALTELGRNYKAYRRYLTSDTFLKSILCPIVVTLVTEAVLHGAPVLLQWIQATG